MNAACAEAKNPETIILNFEEINYINSTEITLILTLLAKARFEAPPPSLRPERPLRWDFYITRLSDFVSVLPDEGSALSEAFVS